MFYQPSSMVVLKYLLTFMLLSFCPMIHGVKQHSNLCSVNLVGTSFFFVTVLFIKQHIPTGGIIWN